MIVVEEDEVREGRGDLGFIFVFEKTRDWSCLRYNKSFAQISSPRFRIWFAVRMPKTKIKEVISLIRYSPKFFCKIVLCRMVLLRCTI